MTQPPTPPYGGYGNDQGGSDPYGQQPQYGQQPASDPYGQQPAADPYGQQPQYGQQPAADPYGQQPAADPYGQQPQYGGGDQYGGSQYGGGGQQYGQQGQPPKKRGALPWILGGCGALLLLAIIAVVVIVLVVRGNSDGDNDPSSFDRPSSSSSDFDSEMDALWDDCDNGDANACDTMYRDSDIDSEYEDFGSTCGGRNDETFGGCVDEVNGN